MISNEFVFDMLKTGTLGFLFGSLLGGISHRMRKTQQNNLKKINADVSYLKLDSHFIDVILNLDQFKKTEQSKQMIENLYVNCNELVKCYFEISSGVTMVYKSMQFRINRYFMKIKDLLVKLRSLYKTQIYTLEDEANLNIMYYFDQYANEITTCADNYVHNSLLVH